MEKTNESFILALEIEMGKEVGHQWGKYNIRLSQLKHYMSQSQWHGQAEELFISYLRFFLSNRLYQLVTRLGVGCIVYNILTVCTSTWKTRNRSPLRTLKRHFFMF